VANTEIAARGRFPTSAYLLCGTPRSGTTLLATLLSSSGLVGFARQHFSRKKDPAGGASGYLDYVRECISRDAGATGVFGSKVLWNDLAFLLDRLRAASRGQPDSDRDLLEGVFPRLRFLWTSRDDLVAQAVSWWRAHQTREWSSTAPRAVGIVPAFDFDEIDRLVGELDAANRGWQRWFAENEIEPFPVVYEDLVADKRGTAARALAFIGVELPLDVPVTERTAKQADGVNDEWIRRYHAIDAARSQR
jgi:LPS sulfotransferase NodH